MDGNQQTRHLYTHVDIIHTDSLFTLSQSGYTHLRHNEIRDTFATLLDEVCHDVEIEPKLQSLEGESFHNKTITTFRCKNFQPPF